MLYDVMMVVVISYYGIPDVPMVGNMLRDNWLKVYSIREEKIVEGSSGGRGHMWPITRAIPMICILWTGLTVTTLRVPSLLLTS